MGLHNKEPSWNRKQKREPVGTELKGEPKDSAVRDEEYTHDRHVKCI